MSFDTLIEKFTGNADFVELPYAEPAGDEFEQTFAVTDLAIADLANRVLELGQLLTTEVVNISDHHFFRTDGQITVFALFGRDENLEDGIVSRVLVFDVAPMTEGQSPSARRFKVTGDISDEHVLTLLQNQGFRSAETPVTNSTSRQHEIIGVDGPIVVTAILREGVLLKVTVASYYNGDDQEVVKRAAITLGLMSDPEI